MTPDLAEHFFRHEYGRLVATLSRRAGVQHLEAIEDAVQSALMSAVETWTTAGLPAQPSAWLFRVAHNELMGQLRTRSGRRRILAAEPEVHGGEEDAVPEGLLGSEVQDDLLRMLFVCCDESIPAPSQLVLALKTLCGFSISEIAHRLFTSEANVYKRLARARARLRETAEDGPESLPRDFEDEDLVRRLPAVHGIVYLLFTEGYLSSHAETAIRRELCEEAIRLGLVLVEHRVAKTPETFALLALMHLHGARISARQDGAGGLLLLEEQDRGQWDRDRIAVGLQWLSDSAQGEVLSRYHLEAGIAAQHCLAPSFEETRWDEVAQGHALLEKVSPSPLHKLNRALAVAQWKGPETGLAVVEGFEPPSWLEGSYMWSAVLADLHRRCGHSGDAKRYREAALASAPTAAVKELLARRLRITSATPPP